MIPQSLGFVIVPTPGTPVPLSVSPLLAAIRIQARSAPASQNVGNVYIGTKGMNKSTGAGVYAVLGPEAVEPFPPHGGPWFDVGQLYLDADNANDGVVIGYSAGP
jgi:hypothetical protein